MWRYIICSVIVCIFLVEKTRKPRFYPPGPPLLPFIGNLLLVWFKLKELKYTHRIWQCWSQKYGNLLGLKLGVVNVVIVSGKEFIKEVCSREVFEGRPDGVFFTSRTFGKKIGLVFSDGPSWNATKRVVIKHLRNFGMGSQAIETVISEECRALVEAQISTTRQPIVVNEMFNISLINILWRIVAGKRYDLHDERLKKLCELITRVFRVSDTSGGIINFFPFLRHVIPGLIGYRERERIHNILYLFLRETIQEHAESLNVQKPRDVIDAFLIEMKEKKGSSFTDEELLSVCLDLLEAGTETVNNTCVFMILHIARNAEVQRLLQQEIDEIIGSRAPTLADRPSMLYTEAVLMEVLRISSVAPMGIPHMALEDAQLGNYIIPKGTYILISLYGMHNGSEWKDPAEFRPERFITKDGNLVQNDLLLPFGTGRRRCLGEGLARSELFLFLTHLLQRFSISLPEGELPSTEPIEGISLSAKPFKAIFTVRP